MAIEGPSEIFTKTSEKQDEEKFAVIFSLVAAVSANQSDIYHLLHVASVKRSDESSFFSGEQEDEGLDFTLIRRHF